MESNVEIKITEEDVIRFNGQFYQGSFLHT